MGSTNGFGHGHIRIGSRTDGSRKLAQTHRISWEIHFGEIPDGLWVLHRCDNPPCVRPDHLFLGTPAINSTDMMSKGRNFFPGPRSRRKLSLDDDAEIVRLLSSGFTQAAVATRFNISQPMVVKVLKRFPGR